MFNVQTKSPVEITANRAIKLASNALTILGAITSGFTKPFTDLSPAAQVVAVAEANIYNSNLTVLVDLGLGNVSRAVLSLNVAGANFVAETVAMANRFINMPEIDEPVTAAFQIQKDFFNSDPEADEETPVTDEGATFETKAA